VRVEEPWTVPVEIPREPDLLIVNELWSCVLRILPVDGPWKPLKVDVPWLCVLWVMPEEEPSDPVTVEEPWPVLVPMLV
jgi:hypothetical protein